MQFTYWSSSRRVKSLTGLEYFQKNHRLKSVPLPQLVPLFLMALTTVEIDKAIRMVSNVNRMLMRVLRRIKLAEAENAGDTYPTLSLNSPGCI